MGKKVLIADDSSVIQTLTKKILVAQDFTIKGLKNGKDVMKAVEKDNYDVILMDINLPGISGLELTKQIRALDDGDKAKVPIIAISGNAMNYTVEEFLSYGITEYIQKPLDYDALVEKVKEYTT